MQADVAKSLPPKTETLLMVGMTRMQRDLYKSILMRNLDAVVSSTGGGGESQQHARTLMPAPSRFHHLRHHHHYC